MVEHILIYNSCLDLTSGTLSCSTLYFFMTIIINYNNINFNAMNDIH